MVSKLDRLPRSTRDLLNTLATIGEAGASFKSLGDPWADTTSPHGRLMLTVLGGLAEFKRHLILSRTNEGRVRAKARGVRFGRKPKLTKHQRDEALARIAQGETLTAIARSYNVSHMTISRLALLWQIYSRCFSVPIQVRQYGHRRGLDRMMRSTMACRMAGSVG